MRTPLIFMPRSLKAAARSTTLCCRGLGVISIDQQDDVPGICIGKMLERCNLVVMRLDERMGHCAVERNIEELCRRERSTFRRIRRRSWRVPP